MSGKKKGAQSPPAKPAPAKGKRRQDDDDEDEVITPLKKDNVPPKSNSKNAKDDTGTDDEGQEGAEEPVKAAPEADKSFTKADARKLAKMRKAGQITR